ncbi:MAG: Lar family restriction alleviation protein [Gemmatimonadales bacterium]|nr:Lar family restriction alleviation protein [Gemmatimonadales bacterium]
MKLKPCPFCGGDANMVREGTRRQSCIIECEDCGARLETGEEHDRSGERWNTRVADTTCAHQWTNEVQHPDPSYLPRVYCARCGVEHPEYKAQRT